MQASYRTFAIVTVTLLAAGSADAQTVRICDREHKTYVQTRACAKAAESATALRQYAWNTRMIHNLVVADFAQPWSAPARGTAGRDAPPVVATNAR